MTACTAAIPFGIAPLQWSPNFLLLLKERRDMTRLITTADSKFRSKEIFNEGPNFS